MDIDLVVLWVDGADPQWMKERNRYAMRKEQVKIDRFREWGLMRYWFRAVEKYMPWVRKVHFVTCGHYPPWLNLSHPKLNFVKHSDFIPEEYLPTFSSHPIELNLHRIEGLSEHFIYFNDDIFLSDYVSPEDFFVKGLPCASSVISPLIALKTDWEFGHILLNDVSFVNANFCLKDVIGGHREKWFSRKYGRYVIKNVYNTLFRSYFLGFEVFHEPASMRKTTYETLWEMDWDLLDNTCKHKFRSTEDVNQYIMTYYHFCTNQFVPRSPKCTGYFDLKNNNQRICDALTSAEYKFIILNDSPLVTDFECAQAQLKSAFERIFPNQSSYEVY